VKRSSYSPSQTSKLPGGSETLDRALGDVKDAFDELAAQALGNVAEANGVWTISPGGEPLAGARPPAGKFFLWVRRVDGKLVTRGSGGTDTVIGAP
jgi:hypothetical protein